MTDKFPTTNEEIAENLRLIRTPAGQPWSGRTRYAAAMFLYQAGLMGSDALEVYRILSRLDHEDPETALKTIGMSVDGIRNCADTKISAFCV